MFVVILILYYNLKTEIIVYNCHILNLFEYTQFSSCLNLLFVLIDYSFCSLLDKSVKSNNNYTHYYHFIKLIWTPCEYIVNTLLTRPTTWLKTHQEMYNKYKIHT